MIAGANTFRVGQPVFSKFEGLFPFQEIEAVVARFFDQLGKFSWREGTDPAFGVNAYPEQDFVLDDIAHSGKDILVEQGIGGQRVGARLQFFPGFPGVPGVVHHIGAPVVVRIDVPGEDFYGAGVEIQVARLELQVQSWRGFSFFIDAIGAKEHKMDADRLVGENDQKMFAPAFEGGYFASGETGKVDFCVAVYFQYLFPGEFLGLFFQDENRWAFGHRQRVCKR